VVSGATPENTGRLKGSISGIGMFSKVGAVGIVRLGASGSETSSNSGKSVGTLIVPKDGNPEKSNSLVLCEGGSGTSTVRGVGNPLKSNSEIEWLGVSGNSRLNGSGSPDVSRVSLSGVATERDPTSVEGGSGKVNSLVE